MAQGVNCVKAGGGHTLLQGLYERFPIRNLIRKLQPHRRDCTAEGPSSVLPLWFPQMGLVVDFMNLTVVRGPRKCTQELSLRNIAPEV